MLVLLAPAAARAQQSELGFSIAAEGFPSYFRYDATPGQELRGAVVLRSESASTEHVLLRAADVTTAGSGGLDYGSGRPGSVGTWIDLERRRVALAPGATITVPFTLRVPGDAGPGDHLAGIVALNRADVRRAERRSSDEAFDLRFLPRLAIATWVTVPGPRDPALAVGNVAFDVTPSGSAVSVLVRDTGNTLIRHTGGRLRLLQGERVLTDQRVKLDAFVPNTEIRYRVPLRGTPARGEYRLVGTLRPEGAAPVAVDEVLRFGSEAQEELREETGQEAKGAIPAWMWILLAFLAAVGAAFGVGYVRARRALKR
ncbi:MAG TPA: hypothetical protein VFR97_13890 [Capillimicrobium sp.]|nr:hypothetical protein [Capillimicrobium sp.]